KTLICDLEKPESCSQIPMGAVDMVLLTNVAHQITNKANLFAEVYRLMKTGGKLVVIDWNGNPSPIGPQSADRVTKEDITQLARKATLKPGGEMNIDPYHFGLIFIK